MVRENYIEKDWETEAGLRAVVVNGFMGVRCGYVGVPRSNPLFGKDYMATELAEVSVHGGLTYAESDRHYPVTSELHWFGFDCAHWGDTPAKCTLAFCVNECEQLADQLARVAAVPAKGRKGRDSQDRPGG